jgi:hypothetical protein
VIKARPEPPLQFHRCLAISAPASNELENASQIPLLPQANGKMPGKSCWCLANSGAASINGRLASQAGQSTRVRQRFNVPCKKLIMVSPPPPRNRDDDIPITDHISREATAPLGNICSNVLFACRRKVWPSWSGASASTCASPVRRRRGHPRLRRRRSLRKTLRSPTSAG